MMPSSSKAGWTDRASWRSMTKRAFMSKHPGPRHLAGWLPGTYLPIPNGDSPRPRLRIGLLISCDGLHHDLLAVRSQLDGHGHACFQVREPGGLVLDDDPRSPDHGDGFQAGGLGSLEGYVFQPD